MYVCIACTVTHTFIVYVYVNTPYTLCSLNEKLVACVSLCHPSSQFCMPFLVLFKHRNTDPVGPPVRDRIALRLHHLHGLLLCGLPPTGRRGRWVHPRTSWDQVLYYFNYPLEQQIIIIIIFLKVFLLAVNLFLRLCASIIIFIHRRPEQMTREVWDYVFFGGELPKTDIPVSALK